MKFKPVHQIAVVIAVKDGVRWIEDAIKSCLNQDLMPIELVIVDDGSTDGTWELVDSLDIPGMVKIRLEQTVWMAEARNVGAAMSTAPLLMFWDADDVMPPDFLLRMAADLKPDAVASYCGRAFITEDGRKPRSTMRAPAYDRVKLWKQNYVPSPMLIRRHDWEAVGRWIEPPVRAMPDWHLALRLSGRGPLSPSTALGKIRRHAGNHMLTWADRGEEAQAVVRQDAATISVVCLYGGRLPGLMPRWLGSVSLSLTASGKKAELIVIDGSRDGWPMTGALYGFQSVTLCKTGGPVLAERARMEVRHQLSDYLAGATNEAMQRSRGDVVWFIEDDMIVPGHAAADLLSAMMSDAGGPAAAVSGLYRSRRRPERFLAARVRRERVEHLTEVPAGTEAVDLTGTGCLMVHREQAPRCESIWRGRSPAHDWCLTGAMSEAGKRVLVVPSVQVKHHTTETDWV